MDIRPRYVYFEDDGSAQRMSQARFSRVWDTGVREACPELAGRRVRFLTLYVRFEDSVAVELVRTEASLVAFDDEGRRDSSEADRELDAAIGLLNGPVLNGPANTAGSEVVPAAARFQAAGFRWKPTSAEIEAAIAVHRLRKG